MLWSRWDGTRVRDVPLLRRIQPYISPTRVEAQVFFELEVETEAAEALCRELCAQSERPVTLFQVFVAAAVRTLHLYPRLNRFVAGRRLYQRRSIWMTFSVKKAFHDDAPVRVVKREFAGTETLDEVSRVFFEAAHEGRAEAATTTEKETRLLLRLPGFLLRVLVFLQRVLDGCNLLPAALARHDAMYSSVFCTNLGSMKIDSCYHHLWNYGTCPFFVNMGVIKEAPVFRDGQWESRRVTSLKCSFDERIEDGFYCAHAIQMVKVLMEDPRRLLEAPGGSAE